MKKLHKQAQKYIPSGVNSPVRAFGAVGGYPVYMKRGKGPFIWDEDDRRYLDFCCSWGPLLFGHAPDALVKFLRKEIAFGTSFGAATRKEIKLAKMICESVPSIEKTRLVSSGTEAVMSAIRLARGFTGRKKILKLDGGYHGHVDSLLVKAGSGAATFGQPDSAGVPEELSRLTLSIPFNDPAALEAVFKKHGSEIAAFILEPVPANMGVIPPKRNYLEAAREIASRYGALLIFDEVITGFRLSPGGAQKYFGVAPDLTCLGKVLGGGFPMAAFGGRSKIMNYLAPGGPVYQAGTLSGNPVAVSAALWMLEHISNKKIKALNKKAGDFAERIRKTADEKGLPVRINAVGSMMTIFFSESPVIDYASAKKANTKRYAKFFHECLKQGMYLAPSQFEAGFVSFAHTNHQLKKAAGQLCKAIRMAVK